MYALHHLAKVSSKERASVRHCMEEFATFELAIEKMVPSPSQLVEKKEQACHRVCDLWTWLLRLPLARAWAFMRSQVRRVLCMCVAVVRLALSRHLILNIQSAKSRALTMCIHTNCMLYTNNGNKWYTKYYIYVHIHGAGLHGEVFFHRLYFHIPL